MGHDLGCPVVGALAAHHAKRCRGVVFASVPYSPESFSLPILLPLVARTLYPADQFPDGQWDYYRPYQPALVSRNGGWFGSAHRAPDVAPDPLLWPGLISRP